MAIRAATRAVLHHVRVPQGSSRVCAAAATCIARCSLNGGENVSVRVGRASTSSSAQATAATAAAAAATAILLGTRSIANAEAMLSAQDAIEKVKQGGRVLDFSELPLSDAALKAVDNELARGNHRFIRVVWAEKQVDSPTKRTIEKAVEEAFEMFEERPTPRVLGELIQLGYKKHAAQLETGVPQGWQVHEIIDPPDGDGYYAVVFVNDKMGHVVLSIKGTESLRDLAFDILAIVKGSFQRPLIPALQTIRKVLELTRENGYRLGFVGHSLGGWHAQLASYIAASRGRQDTYVHTHDTAGLVGNSSWMYEGMPFPKIDADAFDFLHYLSKPNLVNTINEQVGVIEHVITDLELMDHVKIAAAQGLGWVSTDSSFFAQLLAYTLATHSSPAILAVIDPRTGRPKRERHFTLLSWPSVNKMAELTVRISLLFIKYRNTFPKLSDLSDADKRLVVDVAGYNPKPYNPAVISTRHFLPSHLDWLRNAQRVLDQLVSELGVPEERVVFLRNRFEINLENQHVRVENMSGWEFHRQVCRLLTAYPEILQPKLSVSEAQLFQRDLIEEAMFYCDSAILSRLYLFTHASADEIAKHKADVAHFEEEIRLKTALEAKVETREQVQLLSYLRDLSQIHLEFKTRAYGDALKHGDALLSQIQTVPDTAHENFNRYLKAAVLSVKAKIHRSIWKNTEDLEAANRAYKAASDLLPLIPILKSNRASLLHDWAQWLHREGQHKAAQEKFNEAIALHNEAYELSKRSESHWLPGGSNRTQIAQDYARGMYLQAQAEFDTTEDEVEFKRRLKVCLRYLAPALEKPDFNPTTCSFVGNIYRDLQDFDRAKSYFFLGMKTSRDWMDTHGLKDKPRHATLLIHCAKIDLREGNRDEAQRKAEEAIRSLKQKGEQWFTPEDDYYMQMAKDILEK